MLNYEELLEEKEYILEKLYSEDIDEKTLNFYELRLEKIESELSNF